ncbi:hypothetical protein ACIGXM_19290 [Kitasatospora sp. NPDC052896]
MGERAREYAEGERPLTDQSTFLADLTGMSAAALRATPPAPGRAD